MWERHGTAMGAALAEHEAVIAEVVAAHGGRLIKTQGEGDSTLSVFARASDAVAAAVALLQALDRRRWPAGIALRPGGPAHRRGRAARPRLLRAGAQPGGPAAGAGTRRPGAAVTGHRRAGRRPVARRGRAGRRRLAHLLKGLSRPENVFAVTHPDLAAPPPALTEQAEHPDRVAFVGRRSERAELRAALDRALGGQGELVLVAGEAGIGKTRITEELCAEARSQESPVAWGRCREGRARPPTGPGARPCAPTPPAARRRRSRPSSARTWANWPSSCPSWPTRRGPGGQPPSWTRRWPASACSTP